MALVATLDPTCTMLRGALRAKTPKSRRAFTARRSACPDGVVDGGGGEECEPPGAAPCSASCRNDPVDAGLGAATLRVIPPAGIGLDPTELRVTTMLDTAVPAADGTASVATFGGEAQLVIVLGPSGAPMLLGWAGPGHGTVDVRTTAEVLAFLAVGGPLMPATARERTRLLLGAAPEVQPIADATAAALAADANAFAGPLPAVGTALAGFQRMIFPAPAAVVPPVAAGLLVDPVGMLSGITLETTKGLNAIFLTNTFRRPAHAFVEQIAYSLEAGLRTPVNPSLPLTEFTVAPVVGLGDTAGTFAQIAGFLGGGDDTAYVPKSSPEGPLALPVLPATAKEAEYAVVVVGPGMQGDGDLYAGLVTDRHRQKQQEIEIVWFFRDLVLPWVLFALDQDGADEAIGGALGYEVSDVSAGIGSLIQIFKDTVPEVFTLVTAGDYFNAAGVAISALGQSDLLQTQIVEWTWEYLFRLRLYLDTSNGPARAQAFYEKMDKVMKAVGVVDIALFLTEQGVVQHDLRASDKANLRTVTVTKPKVALVPDTVELEGGASRTFRVTVAEAGGSGVPLVYHWRTGATAGHLTDGLAGHQDDFDSSRSEATYTASDDAAGTDTIEVEAFALSSEMVTERTSVGTASATVTVRRRGECAEDQKITVRGDRCCPTGSGNGLFCGRFKCYYALSGSGPGACDVWCQYPSEGGYCARGVAGVPVPGDPGRACCCTVPRTSSCVWP